MRGRFFNPHNRADVARDWQTIRWHTTTQATYGIRYLILQSQIWTARSSTGTVKTTVVRHEALIVRVEVGDLAA